MAADKYTTTRISENTKARIEALQTRLSQRNYAAVPEELRAKSMSSKVPSKDAVLDVALGMLEARMNAEDVLETGAEEGAGVRRGA